MSAKNSKKISCDNPKCITVAIGSNNDSFEDLKAMCYDKSVELLSSIEFGSTKEMDVVFWTEDFPELIGVSHFIKGDQGTVSFRMDFSMTTL